MELIGGIVVFAIIAAAIAVDRRRKRHPSAPGPDDIGISEREWMDAIK
jgi:hypothetical protein